ncbi:neutral amino acid transporter [Lobosporangium transversale]|uniref:Transmembrane amino acid transporter protein-domain-containing protein n=1 Tax=Lobosporangium transversale TaxID=64571 RepID=A0A1Y2GAV8_9FUNG|nr:transmembrane amino acid transporter protein-domain-containing protein [Lobosporangium transversale]KAF9918051.1 neutral amino acid transporter [Lobosporangium transversale]ORZ05886.1 transmembrane amino acid transporter protein-domain-containing protein [Lobosporangium transversale]|eukprot:XP_021877267.1 transmembrane amino acid transporter protein-domain-containing protein [Lobosporangium transversale]
MENAYSQAAVAPAMPSHEDIDASTSITPTLDTNTTTTSATPAPITDVSDSAFERSKSIKRLQADPATVNTSTGSVPELDDRHLHAIVGQHLITTPLPDTNGSSLAQPLPSDSPPKSINDANLLERQRSANSTNAITSAASTFEATVPESSIGWNPHLQLQGGADANDIYKWHAKETRRQLGPRAHTYHAPHTKVPGISAIKLPGGFRRHFLQQDAAARGVAAPKLPTKSFIHYLGLFSMYEFDHFAGENFQSIPRRSIIVPKDPEKRRRSLATVGSHRYFMHSDEVQEDEEVIEEPEELISFSKAVGMLFKTFIASGILFLPNAFKNGGILFAPIFMTLIAILCLHSFLLLVQCRELHPGSYGDIGQRFYGRWMRYIVLFAIAISQFGFCCGYCIFFAQQFAIVVKSLGGADLDKIVWIAIFFVILIPFTLLRNIGKLGFSTLVADLCIIVGLIYLYTYDIKELVINQGSPTPLRLFNSNDFGVFIGTAVFSYEGIGMVIPICGSMANPKQFPRALTIVLAVVCVLLVSFGVLGYAAYGDQVHTIVLDNLPNNTGGEKAGKNAIQLLYIIAIYLTTPLMLFPCIRIVEHAVFKVVGDESSGKVRMLKENIIRIVIDFAVAAVAYAGYTKLDIFISFIGSFACAPLLFIFPPLFHLRAFPGQPLWRKISSIVLILFGFLVFFYTLIINIQSFSKD